MTIKPGILAIVIADEITENIGRIVEVVKPSSHIGNWSCEADRPLWCVERGIEGISVTLGMRVSIPAAHLRPVSGLDLQDEEDETTLPSPSKAKDMVPA